MNGTTSRGLLILVLACASLAVGQQPTVPRPASETKSSAKTAASAVSLSARAFRRDGATHLTIEWKGQESPAILAVAIYSAKDSGPRRSWMGARELFRIALCRSIEEEGSATVEFADTGALAVFGDRTLRVKVYVATELSAHVYENSGVRGGGKRLSINRIGPKDCASAFQAICASNLSRTEAFRGVTAMEFEAPERGSVTTTISDGHVRDLVELTITLGNHQADR